MAKQYQSVDPTLLALNTAKSVLPQTKKQVPASPTTPATSQRPTFPTTTPLQAPSRTFWGITLPFSPPIWASTPQQIGETQQQINSLPKTIPATGTQTPDKYITKDKMKEILSWLPDQSERSQTLDYLVSKWYTIQGLNEPEKTAWGKIMQWAKDIVWATLETATGLPRLAGWLIGEWVWAVAKWLWANKEKTDKLVESWKQSLKENQSIWQNRESGLFKWTKLAWDIISTATPIWFSKTATFWEKVASIPQVSKAISKIPKWLPWAIAKWATIGAKDAAKFTAISESRMSSAKELAIWWTLWGLAPVIGAWASKVMTKKPKVVEDIVWQVVQGSKKDIKPAIETIKNIDTKWIKTYEQLWNKISESNTKVMQAVDWILENDTRLVTPEMFTKTVWQWDDAISTNYVAKAIDHLEELYNKVDDIESQAMIKNTKSLFEQWKLKLKDINDMLRIYSSEFWDKAFSKATQEPLTSVSAQQYENVRKGAKEALRSQFADDTLKQLDEQYSKWARTLELVNKMADKVQKLQQKISDRPFLERAGRLLGRSVDFITGGWLRWLLTSFLPSNIGNKVLNSLDLQEKLVSNLDEIAKLLDKVDMWTASKVDLDLIKKYANTLTTIGGSSLGKPTPLGK